MDSGLKSLLLCNDDKVVRVLRRVLSEMEIAIEHCPDVDSAVQKLTRQRFEAIVVDCTSHEIADRLLRGARSSPGNKRAITVAVVEANPNDSQNALKGAFTMGAQFVLFKPLSLERTRSSFRAVRALMKRERRRHARVPIEFPVELILDNGGHGHNFTTADVGENGMAVRVDNRKLPSSFHLKFSLPGQSSVIECRGDVAWEGNRHYGVRFSDVNTESAEILKQWIGRQLMGAEAEDVSVSCKLTDLSLSACYLQTESPFPMRTRLQLMMKTGELTLQIEGIVRVMHPGSGMGVEFTQHTSSQRTKVEEFIQALVNNTGAIPNLVVRPDSIDNSAEAYSAWQIAADTTDPLLSLFRTKTDLPTDVFQLELRKQRGMQMDEVGA